MGRDERSRFLDIFRFPRNEKSRILDNSPMTYWTCTFSDRLLPIIINFSRIGKQAIIKFPEKEFSRRNTSPVPSEVVVSQKIPPFHGFKLFRDSGYSGQRETSQLRFSQRVVPIRADPIRSFFWSSRLLLHTSRAEKFAGSQLPKNLVLCVPWSSRR